MADASVAVLALLNDGAARVSLATEHVAAPHLIDAELATRCGPGASRGDRRRPLRPGPLDAPRPAPLPAVGLLGRIWELRDNVTTDDAAKRCADRGPGLPLVTADGRLGRAPGPRCTITG